MKKRKPSMLQAAQQSWFSTKGRIESARTQLEVIAQQFKIPTSTLNTFIALLNYHNDTTFINRGGKIPKKEE